MASKTITITMTMKEALETGLLTCKCGHPINNHFYFDTYPCAHCKCKEYREVAVVGTLKKGV